jgi:LacI family transcriptional regulator
MTPKKRSVTMTDVASHAGVSMKTVSNVINDLPCVAEETRQKVLEAIAAVGYRHNHMARSLATGKTNSVGIVIPDVANPFFGAAVRACEDILYAAGYSIFLCNTNEEIERERDYLNQLLSRGVDGLILWGTRICCSDLEMLIGPVIPLITIELDERPSGTRHTAINVDDAGGAEWVIGHLAGEGRRAIAHLAGPLTRITPQRRRAGYLAGLAAAGLPTQPEWIIEEEPSVAGGFRAATAVLAGESSRPDALFCYNDLMAVGALLAARKQGARVPEDVAVAGFDDIDIASIVDPPLTTVRIAQRELGRLAGESLLARLLGKVEGPESVLFPVELVARGSTSRGRLTEADRQATLEQLLSSIMNGQTSSGDKAQLEAQQ